MRRALSFSDTLEVTVSQKMFNVSRNLVHLVENEWKTENYFTMRVTAYMKYVLTLPNQESQFLLILILTRRK